MTNHTLNGSAEDGGSRRQRGNPTLVGKNVQRRREGDKWSYKFELSGITYRGRCSTYDKAEAERIAKQIKGQKLMHAASEDFDTRLSALEDAVAAIRTSVARISSDIAAIRRAVVPTD